MTQQNSRTSHWFCMALFWLAEHQQKTSSVLISCTINQGSQVSHSLTHSLTHTQNFAQFHKENLSSSKNLPVLYIVIKIYSNLISSIHKSVCVNYDLLCIYLGFFCCKPLSQRLLFRSIYSTKL